MLANIWQKNTIGQDGFVLFCCKIITVLMSVANVMRWAVMRETRLFWCQRSPSVHNSEAGTVTPTFTHDARASCQFNLTTILRFYEILGISWNTKPYHYQMRTINIQSRSYESIDLSKTQNLVLLIKSSRRTVDRNKTWSNLNKHCKGSCGVLSLITWKMF